MRKRIIVILILAVVFSSFACASSPLLDYYNEGKCFWEITTFDTDFEELDFLNDLLIWIDTQKSSEDYPEHTTMDVQTGNWDLIYLLSGKTIEGDSYLETSAIPNHTMAFHEEDQEKILAAVLTFAGREGWLTDILSDALKTFLISFSEEGIPVPAPVELYTDFISDYRTREYMKILLDPVVKQFGESVAQDQNGMLPVFPELEPAVLSYQFSLDPFNLLNTLNQMIRSFSSESLWNLAAAVNDYGSVSSWIYSSLMKLRGYVEIQIYENADGLPVWIEANWIAGIDEVRYSYALVTAIRSDDDGTYVSINLSKRLEEETKENEIQIADFLYAKNPETQVFGIIFGDDIPGYLSATLVLDPEKSEISGLDSVYSRKAQMILAAGDERGVSKAAVADMTADVLDDGESASGNLEVNIRSTRDLTKHLSITADFITYEPDNPEPWELEYPLDSDLSDLKAFLADLLLGFNSWLEEAKEILIASGYPL